MISPPHTHSNILNAENWFPDLVLDSPVDEWGRRWTVGAEHKIFDTKAARRMRCGRSRKPLEAMLRDCILNWWVDVFG